MIRIIINGAAGRMGQIVERLVQEDPELTLVGKADASGANGCVTKLTDITEPADVIIDFSNHSAVWELIDYARLNHIAVMTGTTGFTDEEDALLTDAAKDIAIFRSFNMSLGIALLAQMAKQAAAAFPDADIEIVETHHNRKLDAPSGTAILLGESIREVRPDAKFQLGRAGMQKREPGEIGFHAIRTGAIVGIHEVIIATDAQTITLKHEAYDRAMLAEGGVTAAKFLAGKAPGTYGMKDLLK